MDIDLFHSVLPLLQHQTTKDNLGEEGDHNRTGYCYFTGGNLLPHVRFFSLWSAGHVTPDNKITVCSGSTEAQSRRSLEWAETQEK